MNFKQFIQNLIARGKLSKAISELMRAAEKHDADLYNDMIGLSGRQYRNEEEKRKGTIPINDYQIEQNQIGEAVKYFLSDFSPVEAIEFDASILDTPVNAPASSEEEQSGVKVFISYSHSNVDDANKVKAALEAEGIAVLIDQEQLDAGENIADFILEMVKQSDVTISLISKKSLLSRWVGTETILSLQSELLRDGKKFIACALETSFFDDDFVDVCLDTIYEKVDDYAARIAKRRERRPGASTVDLDAKLQRYQKLSNNFPDIINRLNNTLTIDISGNNFEGGIQKVIDTIKDT